MHRHIIADTSCLILFNKIGALSLLYKTYGKIMLTPEVAKEYGRPLPEWVQTVPLKCQDKRQELAKIVDNGEASVIALALEYPGSILIIDDKRGRILAHQLNISITGTLGTLLKAKQKKQVSKIRPYIEKLRQIGYWIAKDIEDWVLKKAGE